MEFNEISIIKCLSDGYLEVVNRTRERQVRNYFYSIKIKNSAINIFVRCEKIMKCKPLNGTSHYYVTEMRRISIFIH